MICLYKYVLASDSLAFSSSWISSNVEIWSSHPLRTPQRTVIMTVTESIKSAVGLRDSSSARTLHFHPSIDSANHLQNYSCIKRRNERSQTPPRIPRQLREPADPVESMSLWDLLSALEVWGECNGRGLGPGKMIMFWWGKELEYLVWHEVLQGERHTYEKCQYVEFKKRVAKMDELRAAKGGERSNWRRGETMNGRVHMCECGIQEFGTRLACSLWTLRSGVVPRCICRTRIHYKATLNGNRAAPLLQWLQTETLSGSANVFLTSWVQLSIQSERFRILFLNQGTLQVSMSWFMIFFSLFRVYHEVLWNSNANDDSITMRIHKSLSNTDVI